MQQEPPGLFEVVAYALAVVLGVEFAKLLTPTLVIMTGWGIGCMGALYIRKVEYRAWPFIVFTFGACLGFTVPVAMMLHEYVPIAVNTLLLAVSLAIPFAGDKLVELAWGFIPEKIRSMFGGQK